MWSRSAPSRAHGALELVDDHRLRIGVVDPEHAADHVDDGMKRHRASERERLALDPGGAAAELPAQLVQQPRLADAGLADDHHDLTLAGLRQLEALAQQA